MKIMVRLFAYFLGYLPDKSNRREVMFTLAHGGTVAHLFELLGISPDLPKVILVNGLLKSLEDELQDGDIVSIFPPMAGG